MSYWTNLFVIWRKLQRAHPTESGHFAPAYLGGRNKLRVSLQFVYGKHSLAQYTNFYLYPIYSIFAALFFTPLTIRCI